MTIILNYHLQEQIPHTVTEFPATYYYDELAALPDCTGPLHWHTDFEVATALSGVLDYQIGQQHIILNKGDSIFVNRNVLHSIRQLSGDVPDPMPNIVFSGLLIASEASTVYKKYIQPIAQCKTLPFIVFRKDEDSVSALIQYRLQKAYQMLDEESHTLQKISDACGFNSVNYFSRQFKKKYGYAPSQHTHMGK